METYIYKTTDTERYDALIHELKTLGLRYHDLKVIDGNWFIIDCKSIDADILKSKGFMVTLDDLILKTC